MFRIAIIIAALLTGHHKVTVTHSDGRGYMTTTLPCSRRLGGPPQTSKPTKIVCVDDHLVVKSLFQRARVSLPDGRVLSVRRGAVYNTHGRLEGWVDWTPDARAIGHVLLKDDLEEEWQAGR